MNPLVKRTDALLILLWMFVIASFCVSHLTNDFFVFIAWGRSVAQNGISGLSSFTDLWEIKGLLSRIAYYLLYVISAIFVDDVGLKYHIIYKIIGCVAVNLFIGMSLICLPQEYVPGKKKMFFLFGIALFSLHFSCHFQPEFFAVILIFLSLALYLRKSIGWSLLAGFVLGLTFFLKSPIPLMGGSLFAVSMLLKQTSFKKEFCDIFPLGVGMLLTIFLGILALKIFNPQEIQDILDASYYQNTLFANPRSVIFGVKALIMGVLRNVWVNAGLLFFISCFIHLAVRKRCSSKDVLIVLVSLFFPALYVLLSNCFFVYHYTLFIFPLLGMLLFVFKDCSLLMDLSKISHLKMALGFVFVGLFYILQFIPLNLKSQNGFWIVLSLVFMLLLLLKKWNELVVIVFLACALGVYLSNSSLISSYIQKANSFFDNYEKNNSLHLDVGKTNDFNNGSVLYLDGGVGLYYCRKPSYLRYFYPLPIQRIDENESNFVKSATFVETKSKILNYQGLFLTLDSAWFFKYPHNEIKNIILSYEKYDVIPSVIFSWDLYPPKPVEINPILVMKRRL